MRAFVGIDLGREPVPDETTACRFRHLAGSFFGGFRAPAPTPGRLLAPGRRPRPSSDRGLHRSGHSSGKRFTQAMAEMAPA